MKILHVFNSLEFSGAEVMYVQAASEFQSKGCDLVALSTADHLGDYASEFKKAGYKVEHRPLTLTLSRLLQFLSTLVWLFKYIKREKIEVVHIHRSPNFWWVSLASRLANARVIRTLHNVYKNRWFTYPKAICERWSARKILGVKFHSIGISVFENELSYYKNPTTKVNNWFDSSRFSPAKNENEKFEIRKELGIGEELVLISVGGCSNVKQHDEIIRAISVLLKKRKIVYLHLGQGEMEKDEKVLVKQLDLQANVRFIGKTSSVRRYLIAADIFLMPSRFEGLGNSAVEALACGIPCVLYDVVGLRDLIKENRNGLLIKPDVENLIDAVNKLADSEILRTCLAEEAIVFANENFSLQQGVEGMLRLYNKS